MVGERDHLLGGQSGAGELIQGSHDGAFDRVRGGQPGAERDVGVEEEVEARDVEAALLQGPDHAQRVLGPAVDGARRQGGGVGLDEPLVAERGQQPDSAVFTEEPSRSRTAVLARLSIAKGRTKPSL